MGHRRQVVAPRRLVLPRPRCADDHRTRVAPLLDLGELSALADARLAAALSNRRCDDCCPPGSLAASGRDRRGSHRTAARRRHRRNPEVDAFRVEAGTWSAFAEGLEASGAIAPDDILVATSWRDASRVAEALRIPNLVLAFEANPHGFAWLASPAGYIGRDALIVTRSWDTPLVLASFAPYFESFAPVGNWPTDEGNRHTIDVTRGRLVAPYPMPYPRR
jgi:hypothetical protein